MTDLTPHDRDRTDTLVAEHDAPNHAGLLSRAAGVIRAPTTTFRGIARHEPVGHALAVVVAATILLTVVQGFGAMTAPRGTPQTALVTLLTGLVIGLPAGLAFFLVWVGAVLLGAKLLGGSGSFPGTVAGLGFAYVPLALGGLVAALALPFGAAAGAIVVLAFLATTAWSFALDVLAVREAHSLSTGRAVGAVVLPAVALAVLTVALLGALFIALFLV